MSLSMTEILQAYHQAPVYGGHQELLRASVLAAPPGLMLEFGVATGLTITTIAGLTEGPVYGFDSFKGLPEKWNDENLEGMFDRQGQEPGGLPANVVIVKGLFQETLPDFLSTHEGEVGLVHVDCDLYSSSKYVLALLAPRLAQGAIINFNEFWDYPEAHLHEIKAFSELVEEYSLTYECIGRASLTYTQAAFKVFK